MACCLDSEMNPKRLSFFDFSLLAYSVGTLILFLACLFPPSSFVYALGKAAKSYGEIRYVKAKS